VVNSWFDKGYKFPTNDLIYATLSSVQIGHQDGYLYVYATPNFEKIDMFNIATWFLEQTGTTWNDLYDLVVGEEENTGGIPLDGQDI